MEHSDRGVLSEGYMIVRADQVLHAKAECPLHSIQTWRQFQNYKIVFTVKSRPFIINSTV